MYFEYNFMNIDAVILMPDTNSIEMAREKNLTSDNNIKLKVSFTVETYYPAFRSDRVNAVGYPQQYGTGMVDANGFALAGGVSSLFDQPGSPGPSGVVNGPAGVIPPNRVPGSPIPPNAVPNIPDIAPIGTTGSFYNTQGAGSPGDQYGTFANSDFTAIVPRRSRWFNNILKSREKSNISNTNPNGNNIP